METPTPLLEADNPAPVGTESPPEGPPRRAPRRGLKVQLTSKTLPVDVPRLGWKLGRCDYCRNGSKVEELLPVRKTPSKTLICPTCFIGKRRKVGEG